MASLIFWLGRAPCPFEPDKALAEGIGGSELAAIHLTSELSRLGHQIDVFADVPEVVGMPGSSVVWYPWRTWTEDKCRKADVFVSSRELDPIPLQKKLIEAKQKWLWVHDLHVGADWANKLDQYDKLICLSSFARDYFLHYYARTPAEKIAVIGNGLDHVIGTMNLTYPGLHPGSQHARFVNHREPLRAIYSSSPDRGLDKLLDLWPAIRREVMETGHEAELHVYYGFATWQKIADLYDRIGEANAIDRLKKAVGAPEAGPEAVARAHQAGIIYHGRVGQSELARAFLSSHLWLYPTDFLETSCITAMEARAAGCHAVVTRCGALPETFPEAHFVPGPTWKSHYDECFLREVRKIVQEPLRKPELVGPAPKRWSKIALQWNDLVAEAAP